MSRPILKKNRIIEEGIFEHKCLKEVSYLIKLGTRIIIIYNRKRKTLLTPMVILL